MEQDKAFLIKQFKRLCKIEYFSKMVKLIPLLLFVVEPPPEPPEPHTSALIDVTLAGTVKVSIPGNGAGVLSLNCPKAREDTKRNFRKSTRKNFSLMINKDSIFTLIFKLLLVYSPQIYTFFLINSYITARLSH